MSGIDSYVKSMLHFQNRVWTFAGTAQIDTAQKKFGTASLLLDGDSDYISTPNSADFDFGSGDWTIDCWIRRNGTSAYPGIVGAAINGGNGYMISLGDSDNKVRVVWNASLKITSTGTVADLTWTHVAVVRNGNTVTCYINGVPDGTDDCTGDSINSNGTGAVIGRLTTDTSGNYWNGHIDELRITKGLARWTADFSASLPTTKYADDANTVSLLHFDEADASTFTKDVAANWTMDGAAQFYDETGKVWTASGNAQLDTAQYKWTASGLFDGTGDYISTPDHDDFAFGSGDFTIDLWARLAGTSGIQILVAQRADVDNRWNLFLNFSAAQGLGFYWKPTESYLIQGSNAGWSTGTWYHIAVTRNGNEFKVYRDGTALATATLSGALPDLNALVYVGGTADGMFAGHIDELRISKGIARWTTDFTPSTSEYSPVTVAYPPYLTDTDTVLAPSINHVFPPYLTDTDTFLVPSINHVFPGTITDTDTFLAPVFNYALKMSVYTTDTDTVVAPKFGRAIPLTIPAIDTDTLLVPILEGVPVARHRVKVNLV